MLVVAVLLTLSALIPLRISKRDRFPRGRIRVMSIGHNIRWFNDLENSPECSNGSRLRKSWKKSLRNILFFMLC